MYISYSTSGREPKITYAYVFRNVFVDKGKCRKDKVKNLGRLDDLLKEYPGLDKKQLKEKLTEVYLSKDKKLVSVEFNLEKKVPVIVEEKGSPLTADSANHDNPPQQNFLYYGHLLVLSLLAKFNLSKLFSENDYMAFSHMLALQCIDPDSKLASIESLKNYIGLKNVYTPKYYYEMLGRVYQFKEEIIKRINAFIDRHNIDCATYDTTNFYFEINQPDKDSDDSQKSSGKRKHGFSKENRPNPIIQLGLLSDKEGLPITYETFSGNTLDCQTVKPIIEKYKKLYGIKKILFISDAGMNTIDNARKIAENYNYLFRLAITHHVNVEVKKAIDDKENWTFFEESKTDKMKHIEVERYQGFKEKVLITYKQKYFERDMIEKAKIRQKINEMIQKGIDPASKDNRKYSRYFDKKKKENGELVDAEKPIYVFNEKELDKQFKYAGYYALITNVTDMPDEEMINHYCLTTLHETLFNTLKSVVKTRPIYVWKPEHIEGHFLICYVALSIIKIFEKKLNEKFKIRYSPQRIQEALADALLAVIKNNFCMFKVRGQLLENIITMQSLNELLSQQYFYNDSLIRKVNSLI
jgi:transposase